MRRELWRVVKRSKRFYVRTYRFAGSALIFSLMMNVMLGLAIYQTYFYKPERHFYVTNGIVPPTELMAMDAANESSVPLLANDPDVNDDKKILIEEQ